MFVNYNYLLYYVCTLFTFPYNRRPIQTSYVLWTPSTRSSFLFLNLILKLFICFKQDKAHAMLLYFFFLKIQVLKTLI